MCAPGDTCRAEFWRVTCPACGHEKSLPAWLPPPGPYYGTREVCHGCGYVFRVRFQRVSGRIYPLDVRTRDGREGAFIFPVVQ